MACDITAGKSRGCRTGFGGADYFVVVQKEHISTYAVVGQALDSISLVSGKQGWKIEVEEETSNAQAVGTGNRQNNTYVSVQTVTIANGDYADATRQLEDEISQNELVIFVAYSDGTNKVFGLENGMMLDTATHNSGTAHEDKNGTDWVFSGKEKKAPYSVSTAIMEALLDVAS